MARYALGVEYCGASFMGWQRQHDCPTVQLALEKALSQIADELIEVTTAGRTDRGVHALQQVIHFDTECIRPLIAWVRGVNDKLPPAVSVLWVQQVSADFHARYSATARTYRYLLLQRSAKPGLWHQRFGWTHWALDLAAMQQACQYLLGSHDFSCFRSAQCQARNPTRHISQAEVRQQGDLYVFEFTANAFLHHMIRNIIGSLVAVGSHRAEARWIAELIQQKDRRLAAPTFSPDGLYFVGPHYPAIWQLPSPDVSAMSMLACLGAGQ